MILLTENAIFRYDQLWHIVNWCEICMWITFVLIISLFIYDTIKFIWFTYKKQIFKALSVGTTTHLSWRDDRHVLASLSLKMDVGRSFTQFFNSRIRRFIWSLGVLTHFDNVSSSSYSQLVHAQVKRWNGRVEIARVMFNSAAFLRLSQFNSCFNSQLIFS